MLTIQKTFQGQPVRAFQKDGAAWFVLADVCAALGIANPRNVAARLDEDEKDAVHLPDAIGRPQSMTTVSESGLYAVILRSDKPQARPFRKWVTGEVLPSIRQTGAYALPGEGASQRVAVGLVTTGALAHATGRSPRDIRKTCQRQGLKPVGLTRPAHAGPSYLYPLQEAAQVFGASYLWLPAPYRGPVFPFAGPLPFHRTPRALPSTAKKEDPRALALSMLAHAEDLTRQARALLEATP